ncbi:2,3,4,5-tetrahydropyridine-2,6-dicarboxylate N-succinyltransferase, partial [Bacteroidetes/Chlorobi group bacterium ChocPot_Mid]
MEELKNRITEIYNNNETLTNSEFLKISNQLIDGLNLGLIRSAEKDNSGNWKVNIWVKQGILLLFKYGRLSEMSVNDTFRYF